MRGNMDVFSIERMSAALASLPVGHVLITGGTGFIGTGLCERLLDAGVRVSVLTRDRDRARVHFRDRVGAVETLDVLHAQDAPDIIVNLAGQNLGAERWNDRVKRDMIASRVLTTQHVVDYIAGAEIKPALLISGSAVGYYGARGAEALTEDSPPGAEYQSQLCVQWETAAAGAERYGVRVCVSRTGVVMGRGGGALAGLAPMFRLGLGAVAGSGKQWVSWIHRQDLIDIFLNFMRDDTLAGPFNNTSPTPVTNREFAASIGQALRRPVLLRTPGALLRALYGEMAHLYITGQKVIPARHLQMGFEYRYPDIGSAVAEALQ
jgi:uncharacterized protein (TIGR01777 family)